MTEPLQITHVEADENGTQFTLSDGRVLTDLFDTDLLELQRLVGGTLLLNEANEPKGIAFGTPATIPPEGLHREADNE